MSSNAEKQVLYGLFLRYQNRICEHQHMLQGAPNKCDAAHLHALCEEAMSNADKYPADKMHRWLGFVQGVLAARGIIDVDVERDYTRPLFHALYGREVPTF